MQKKQAGMEIPYFSIGGDFQILTQYVQFAQGHL